MSYRFVDCLLAGTSCPLASSQLSMEWLSPFVFDFISTEVVNTAVMRCICTLVMHSSHLQDETLSWLHSLFPWRYFQIVGPLLSVSITYQYIFSDVSCVIGSYPVVLEMDTVWSFMFVPKFRRNTSILPQFSCRLKGLVITNPVYCQ
jgi:hypothetical protein